MASTFPQQIDIIPLFLDVTQADVTMVTNFQTAMQNGNFALANQYLSQIENVNQKIINANRLNQLRDSILALEKFYGTDIVPYVTQKQTEWQGIIDQFQFKGTYSSAIIYKINNFVLFYVNGSYDLYIKTSNIDSAGIPPTDNRYWRVLTVQGERGVSASGTTTFYFDWVSSQSYNVNSIVSFNNKWWNCTQQNVGNQPTEGSSYWQLVMSSMQTLYPIQPNQPTSQGIGELWFETL